jgi:hypothetical protein
MARPAFIDFGAAGHKPLPSSHDFGVASRGGFIGDCRTAIKAACHRDAIRDSRIITFRQQTAVGRLGTNDFLDCGSRKTAGRSSTLLPLLQCSLRDLQFQGRLALRKIISLAPRSQSSWKRTGCEPVMPNMIREGSESHPDTIRESRIVSSPQPILNPILTVIRYAVHSRGA